MSFYIYCYKTYNYCHVLQYDRDVHTLYIFTASLFNEPLSPREYDTTYSILYQHAGLLLLFILSLNNRDLNYLD